MKFIPLLFVITASLSSGVRAQKSVPSIRSTDFANQTYPWPLSLATPSNRTFKLRDGAASMTPEQMGVTLAGIEFTDLTGDRNEEAIVKMSVQTGGSALPAIVYVYAHRNGYPTLLWSLVTGDRADGGLRNVYGSAGRLVVETFGPKRRDESDGQPARYTIAKYRWHGGKFLLAGKKKVISLQKNP